MKIKDTRVIQRSFKDLEKERTSFKKKLLRSLFTKKAKSHTNYRKKYIKSGYRHLRMTMTRKKKSNFKKDLILSWKNVSGHLEIPEKLDDTTK